MSIIIHQPLKPNKRYLSLDWDLLIHYNALRTSIRGKEKYNAATVSMSVCNRRDVPHYEALKKAILFGLLSVCDEGSGLLHEEVPVHILMITLEM